MTDEDIKKAALHIIDLERIPLIVTEVEGAALTITIGNNTVNVPSDRGSKVRVAIIDYLEDLTAKFQGELAALRGKDKAPDPDSSFIVDFGMDEEIDALAKDAEPKGTA